MKNLKFFILQIAALISVLVIRCVQIVFLINPENGFFYDNYESIGTLLTIFIVVITAFGALFGFFVDTKGINPKPDGNVFIGIISALMGISQIAEALTLSDSALVDVPQLMIILRAFAIIISGIIFCYFGICYIAKREVKYSFIYFTVIAWVLRLITTFISFSNMSNISDNLYDILMLSATTIFLLYHGKQICGIETPFGIKTSFIFGSVAMLTTAAAVMPHFVLPIFNLKEFSRVRIDNPITGLLFAVYVFVYLISICKKERTKD